MRVKVKGFESGKSYNIYNGQQQNVSLDMYVFFSKKNYVLLSYYDRDDKVEKKYATSKRIFKEFLDLPFPIIIEEMNNKDFFSDYYNRYEDYTQGYDDEYLDTLSCGCCSCCGCSCDDHLYYDYDYEEDDLDEE